MKQNHAQNKVSIFWKNNNAKLVLVLLLLIFSAYSLFLALNLRTGVIPDETYRFEVATYFADTWSIPSDVPIAYTSGDNLQRNPYLGYWLYGRAISIIQAVRPAAGEWQILVGLRIFNWLFALGTVIFVYGLSKELIENKWWQLLPVFMLTNTLMYVFLSGGVNYDNPVNFACAAALYFLARVLNKRDFVINSLGWLVFISIACLIKYSILPLALVMGIFWLIYLFKNKKALAIKPLKSWGWGVISLTVVLALLIGLNISLYGVNLVKFHSLTPACTDTFPTEVCEASFFGTREREMALSEKLTLIGALKQGHPDPIRYVFDEWIREMLKRVYGIMGESNYFPINITYFHIALYWIILMGFRYIRKPSYKVKSLMGIFGFYAIVLIAMNYNSELVYGFNKYVALQGRYIFPVIGIAYTLITHVLMKVSNKTIQWVTVIALIALFLYSGPIRFIWYYDSVFADWFI